MTPVDVLTTGASRNRRMLNFFVVTASGGWILWDESRQPDPSMIWYAIAALFLIWGLVILRGILRPLMMRVTENGICVRTVFGSHDIAWNTLDWVDFERPRSAVLGYHATGTSDIRMALVLRSMADPAQLAEAYAAIIARCPTIPTSMPAVAPVPA